MLKQIAGVLLLIVGWLLVAVIGIAALIAVWPYILGLVVVVVLLVLLWGYGNMDDPPK